MTDTTTPRTALPLLAAAQAQKHVTHNEALLQLDALLFARFLDRDLTAPPASPADGDTYLVHATASGDWTGKDGQIAFASDGAWRFYAPFTGLAAFVVDEAVLVVFTGSAWVDYASILNFQNVPLLGVNTTADSTNKLAAKSSAILLDNIGNGIQAKLNKHASGDTASLLYQTNYSGRAEIGLTGDDNFHFKVSPDGSAWFDGLDINGADGSVDFLASETTLASAATTDLGTASSLRAVVTGTTTVTSFGTRANKLRLVRFAGALTLTHNATSLILLGGASRTTAAGDVGIYTSDASGNWRERDYCRAATDAGDLATRTGTETLTNKTLSGDTLSGNTVLPGSGQLSSSGQLGLKRTPSYDLDVNGTGRFSSTLHLATGQAIQFDGDGYLKDSTGALYFSAGTNVGFGTAGGTGDLFFSIGDAYSGTHVLTCKYTGAVANTLYLSAGQVGIGSNAPVSGSKLDVAGHIYPHTDNSYNLGSASYRFATVYAATGTINTSGGATKTDVRPLSDAELAVARALGANVRIFQFVDAVAAKGAGAARLHAGMIYEEVAQAFAAQGLDPARYGIVCRDAGEAGDVLGLRYGELAQFVMAGLAARLATLESHLPPA